jgi:prepilin-type N-terminal cleavage/methylation domain-containing protein/prepilin-type processing-associated H-X9-DG protein
MNKKAFTLIELLVVIAIVGILIAIMIPVMGRVREGARRATCLNNLRQHGIAWYLYLDEHDYRFPRHGDASDGCMSMHSFGGKQGRQGPENAAEYRPLNRYLDIENSDSPNVKLFQCPADIKPCLGTSFTIFDHWGSSYGMNTYIVIYWGLLTLPQPPKEMPLSIITRSHSRVWLETDDTSNIPGHGGRGFVVGKTPVMVLFVDGHAAGPFLYQNHFETMTTGRDSSKKVWYYPN